MLKVVSFYKHLRSCCVNWSTYPPLSTHGKGAAQRNIYPRRLTGIKHNREKPVKSAKHRLRRQALDRLSRLCYLISGDGEYIISFELQGAGQRPAYEPRVNLARGYFSCSCFFFGFESSGCFPFHSSSSFKI